MGWTDVPWYTIRSEGFSADFGVDEWFGLNVFLRKGDEIYRTYFLQHGAMVQWWTFWFRRHDEFDDPPPSARLHADAG